MQHHCTKRRTPPGKEAVLAALRKAGTALSHDHFHFRCLNCDKVECTSNTR